MMLLMMHLTIIRTSMISLCEYIKFDLPRLEPQNANITIVNLDGMTSTLMRFGNYAQRTATHVEDNTSKALQETAA